MAEHSHRVYLSRDGKEQSLRPRFPATPRDTLWLVIGEWNDVYYVEQHTSHVFVFHHIPFLAAT